MEHLVSNKRQSQKDQFMKARAAAASSGPANPHTRRKPGAVRDLLGFIERGAKKARYAKGKEEV